MKIGAGGIGGAYGLPNIGGAGGRSPIGIDQVLNTLRSGDPTKIQALKDQIEGLPEDQKKALLEQLKKAAENLGIRDLDELIKWLQEMLGIKPPGGGGGGGGGGAKGAGGGGGGGGAEGAGGAGGGGGAQGAGGAGGAAGAGGMNAAGGPVQSNSPEIQKALNAIGNDPEGGRLLQAAQEKGLLKVVEDKSLPPGVQGRYTNNGDGTGTIAVRDAKSPDLVATLVHELGHAATPENNSSQLEERTVDAIGARVQARVTGRNKIWDLNTDAYSSLPWDNGIKDALRRLGVDV